jgi:hypothetical protein
MNKKLVSEPIGSSVWGMRIDLNDKCGGAVLRVRPAIQSRHYRPRQSSPFLRYVLSWQSCAETDIDSSSEQIRLPFWLLKHLVLHLGWNKLCLKYNVLKIHLSKYISLFTFPSNSENKLFDVSRKTRDEKRHIQFKIIKCKNKVFIVAVLWSTTTMDGLITTKGTLLTDHSSLLIIIIIIVIIELSKDRLQFAAVLSKTTSDGLVI